MTSNNRDPYGNLTVADLQLIARARSLDIPAGAERDEIILVLRGHDARPPAPTARKPTLSTTREPTGWWTSMSVAALRTVARDHGIDVPAGMHRRELVGIIIEYKVPRP